MLDKWNKNKNRIKSINENNIEIGPLTEALGVENIRDGQVNRVTRNSERYQPISFSNFLNIKKTLNDSASKLIKITERIRRMNALGAFQLIVGMCRAIEKKFKFNINILINILLFSLKTLLANCYPLPHEFMEGRPANRENNS